MKRHNNKTATQWSKMNVCYTLVGMVWFGEAVLGFYLCSCPFSLIIPCAHVHHFEGSKVKEKERDRECIIYYGGYRIFFERLVLSDRNPLLLCIYIRNVSISQFQVMCSSLRLIVAEIVYGLCYQYCDVYKFHWYPFSAAANEFVNINEWILAENSLMCVFVLVMLLYYCCVANTHWLTWLTVWRSHFYWKHIPSFWFRCVSFWWDE